MTDVSGKAARRGFDRTALLVLPAVAVYGVVLVAPMVMLAIRSVTAGPSGASSISLGNYALLFSDPFYLRTLLRTLRLAAVVTGLCVLIGWPVAFCLSQVGRRWHLAVTLIVVAPLLISVVVRTFGWVVVLGPNGLIDGFLQLVGAGEDGPSLLFTETAVVVGMVHVMLPLMIVSIQAALNGIDRNLVWAAMNLGASPVRAVLRVNVPLSVPGIMAGIAIVFGLSASAFITPAVLGGATTKFMSTLIFQNTMITLNFGMGGALSIILLLSTMLVVSIAAIVVERLLLPGVFLAQRREH